MSRQFVQPGPEMATGSDFYVCLHARRAIRRPAWTPGGLQHIVIAGEIVITHNGFQWHLLYLPRGRTDTKYQALRLLGGTRSGLRTSPCDSRAPGTRVMASVRGRGPDSTWESHVTDAALKQLSRHILTFSPSQGKCHENKRHQDVEQHCGEDV